MDVKPLHFCSPDEVMKEGLIAYIIHHPGEGVDGPVGMARSFNSSVIAGFKGELMHRQNIKSFVLTLIGQSIIVCIHILKSFIRYGPKKTKRYRIKVTC